MACPRSLPAWNLSHTWFIWFAWCISRSVSWQVAPCCGANSRWFDSTQCYLRELNVIIRGPLGCLLLSIIILYWEREPIARVVNFLLISESVQSKSYSLGEACLKVGLLDWWALQNCNHTLNCVSHPGSTKQNRSLHTCAQDVQITRTANNMVNRYNISLNYKLESFTKW
jgi:hypothetical protein